MSDERRPSRLEPPRPEPPHYDPRLTGLLALQRGAGNRAVSRLLDGRMLLRSPTPQDRRAFAEKWARLEERLEFAMSLGAADKLVVQELWIAAQSGGWLQAEVPDVFARLKQLAEGTTDLTPAEIVGKAQPDPEYSAVAAAVHHPGLAGGDQDAPYKGRGGGGFAEPSMTAAEVAEKKRLVAGGLEATPMIDLPTVDARINLALTEVDKAFHHHRVQPPPPGVDPDEVVLVYVGPEWFFRRPDRPYTREERDHVVKTITAASRMYPDLVLMPGTIISAYVDEEVGAKELTNTAPVALNGKLLTTVDKSDDAGDTAGLVPAALFSAEARKREGSSFFDVGNLRFAIDICVDHQHKRARKELQRDEGEDVLSTGGGADVHIVTGAGQSPERDKLAARVGGLAIGADAQGSGGTAAVREITAPDTTGPDRPTAADLSVIDKPEPSPAELAKMYPDPATRARFVRKRYHPNVTSYFAPVVIEVRTGQPVKV